MNIKELIEHYHDDFNNKNGMYLIHSGLDDYPSFYYQTDDNAIYIQSEGGLSLLSYEVNTIEKLYQFFELVIGIEYPNKM